MDNTALARYRFLEECYAIAIDAEGNDTVLVDTGIHNLRLEITGKIPFACTGKFITASPEIPVNISVFINIQSQTTTLLVACFYRRIAHVNVTGMTETDIFHLKIFFICD